MTRMKCNKIIHEQPTLNVSSRRFMNHFERRNDGLQQPTNRESLLNSEHFPKERSSHNMIDYYIFQSGFETQILSYTHQEVYEE